MQIRPVDLAFDADLYVEGYCESFRESYPGVGVTDSMKSAYRESLVNLDSTPGLAAFTAQAEGGDSAGFMVLAVAELDAATQVSIDVIYVAEPFRGEGVARALLAYATQYAKSVGAVGTRLDVSAGNKVALALYESEGYVVTRYQMEKSAA